MNALQSFSTLFIKVSLVAIIFAGLSLPAPSIPQASAQTCSTTTTPATTYGQVTQSVNVATAGTYRVWSRIKAPDTTNNSYYFQVDGGCAVNVGDAASIAANTWTWVNYQNGNTGSFIDITLTAGTHQLAYTGKEADVQLDRILMLGDLTCVPTGTGDNCATADTTPPTTSITAPAGGTTVSAGSTVTINANAADDTGVAKVEFYVDGALKSTDTTSPYSYAWSTNGVAAGAHSLTTLAYDAANNSTTSAAVNITIGASTSTVDLVVSDITWAPATFNAGGAVTFSAVVKNQGTTATPAGVGIGLIFQIDGANVNWTTRSTAIAPGESVTMTATGGASGTGAWTATAGAHTIVAQVDDTTVIAESNEANNTLSETFTTGAVTFGNGDANADSRVNAIDLSIVLSKDGQNFPAADFNKDGTVGAADMAILLGKWTW